MLLCCESMLSASFVNWVLIIHSLFSFCRYLKHFEGEGFHAILVCYLVCIYSFIWALVLAWLWFSDRRRTRLIDHTPDGYNSSHMTPVLTDLQPATRYVAYGQAYALSNAINGAISPYTYFTTATEGACLTLIYHHSRILLFSPHRYACIFNFIKVHLFLIFLGVFIFFHECHIIIKYWFLPWKASGYQ